MLFFFVLRPWTYLIRFCCSRRKTYNAGADMVVDTAEAAAEPKKKKKKRAREEAAAAEPAVAPKKAKKAKKAKKSKKATAE